MNSNKNDLLNNYLNSLTEIELNKRKKLKVLEDKKYNVFGKYKFKKNNYIKNVVEKYKNYSKEELENMNILTSVTGRVLSIRSAGQVKFLDLYDFFSKIQIYINVKNLSDVDKELFNNIDVSDIYSFSGKVFKTKLGELSIFVNEITILAKSLTDLPDKYYGLKNIEEIYRKRHIDLILNKHSRQKFIYRLKVIQEIRNFLVKKKCVEVETPILQSIYGGAQAKPFITKFNALNTNFYLRIAPELYLKRLIVSGFERVFELGKVFRNEGLSPRHNPEFTMLELYIAYFDVFRMIDLIKELINYILKTVFKGQKVFKYQNLSVNFNNWKFVHIVDIIKEKLNIDFWNIYDFEEAKKLAIKNNIKVEKHHNSVGHIIVLFFEEFIEGSLVDPTFIYGYPREVSPLAAINLEDTRFTNRFELYIAKYEIMNGFEELNNPISQLENFITQKIESQLGNDESPNTIDYDYVKTLEQGMPPTVGLGIGIDRLIMILTNSKSIKEIIFFPHLKNKN